MIKRVDYVVAVIIRKAADPDKFLVVQRPSDDSDLPGSWGLPAVTQRPGELIEEAAKRACREKLGCNAIPVRFVGMMFQKRNSYDLFLTDVEMVLAGGSVPDVTQAKTEGTQYTTQRWTTDYADLMASAKAGSCCSSILLTDRGILDRNDWVSSLEGSSIVA